MHTLNSVLELHTRTLLQHHLEKVLELLACPVQAKVLEPLVCPVQAKVLEPLVCPVQAKVLEPLACPVLTKVLGRLDAAAHSLANFPQKHSTIPHNRYPCSNQSPNLRLNLHSNQCLNFQTNLPSIEHLLAGPVRRAFAAVS